jgi:DNA repair protein RadC
MTEPNLRPTSAGRYRIKTFSLSLAEPDPAPESLPLASDPLGAKEVARAIFATMEPDQEHTVFLALNCRNRIIGFRHTGSGTLDRAMVDPRMIFRDALLLGAANIILVHNHPSGDPTPSKEDRDLTRRLVLAGESIGILLIDHIVLGSSTAAVSFREAGLI